MVRFESLVSRKPSYIVGMSAVVGVLAVLAFFLLPARTPGLGGWREWSQLLVHESTPLEDVVGILERAGASPVWSELNQTVYLTDFVSASRIALPDALRRLLPDDPRKTPWLDRLEDFYTVRDGGEVWRVIYFPRKDVRIVSRAVNRYVQEHHARVISETYARGPGALWLPCLALAAAAVFLNRRSRLYTLCSAFPWIPLWLSGSPTPVLAGVVGFLVLTILGHENDFQPGRVAREFSWNSASRALPAVVAFFLFMVSDVRFLGGIAVSGLCAVSLLFLFESVYQRRDERRVHETFLERTIDVSRREWSLDRNLERWTLICLTASAVVLALSAAPVKGGASKGASIGVVGSVRIPSPGARVDSFSGMARRVPTLVKERAASQLPDLADALAHRIFQEALPFSRIGSREYGDTSDIIVERYHSDSSAVEAERECVLKFDEAWMRKALDEETAQGIGLVLRSQGGACRVEQRPMFEVNSPASLASKNVFFYIMLLAPVGMGFVRQKRRTVAIRRSPSRSAAIV